MCEKMDLSLLENFLKDIIPPLQLAEVLDKVTYSYARMIIRLHKIEDGDSAIVPEEADSYLHYMNELSGVLKKTEKEN